MMYVESLRNHAELVRIYYEDIGLKEHIDKYPCIMNMIERHMAGGENTTENKHGMVSTSRRQLQQMLI